MRTITPSVHSVGVLNPNLRVFDIVMKTDYGTSYNSFIIKGEKTALIETCHNSFFDEYLENVLAVTAPDKIDYIILNHTEPDHSGALARFSQLCPKAEIICSQAASMYLKNITNKSDLNLRVVKDGDTLDLGGGKELQFIIAPFLHWPDSMFTYFGAEKLLFSCDFFGTHYCEPRLLDKHIAYPDKYNDALKGYYDAIFGPFPTYVQNGLAKIKDLAIDMVCTSHGPILTADGILGDVIKLYQQWSAPKVPSAHKSIPIFYSSAYGNTRLIAKTMAAGILEILPDALVDCYDIINHDITVLAGKLMASDAFLLGTPTLNRDAVPPIWLLLAHLDAINIQKRPVAVFGSYGWSGEAVPAVMQRLTTLKLKVAPEGFKFTFVPSPDDIANAKEFARTFAQSL